MPPDEKPKPAFEDNPWTQALESAQRLRQPSPLDYSNPASPSAYQMLKDAVKVVPAVKYAQGVLGVVCVVVIIGLLKLNLFFAALGVLIMLGLMFGLLLFAIAVRQPHDSYKAPALVMIWVFVLTFVGILGLAVSCIFWEKPIDYPSLIAQFSANPTAEYEAKIRGLNNQLKHKNELELRVSLLLNDYRKANGTTFTQDPRLLEVDNLLAESVANALNQ